MRRASLRARAKARAEAMPVFSLFVFAPDSVDDMLLPKNAKRWRI